MFVGMFGAMAFKNNIEIHYKYFPKWSNSLATQNRSVTNFILRWEDSSLKSLRRTSGSEGSLWLHNMKLGYEIHSLNKEAGVRMFSNTFWNLQFPSQKRLVKNHLNNHTDFWL